MRRFVPTCSRSSITLVARSLGRAYSDFRPLLEDNRYLRGSRKGLKCCDAPRVADGNLGDSEVKTMHHSEVNVVSTCWFTCLLKIFDQMV